MPGNHTHRKISNLRSVRRADGIDSRARILIDDVLRPGCFDEQVCGHKVVLSALGIKRALLSFRQIP